MIPWKYGFKSAKSIVKIRFVEQQPVNSWQYAQPSEYGFYSNVNPDVSIIRAGARPPRGPAAGTVQEQPDARCSTATATRSRSLHRDGSEEELLARSVTANQLIRWVLKPAVFLGALVPAATILPDVGRLLRRTERVARADR